MATMKVWRSRCPLELSQSCPPGLHERNGRHQSRGLYVAASKTFFEIVCSALFGRITGLATVLLIGLVPAWVVGEPGMCSVVNLLLFATEGLAYNHRGWPDSRTF